MSNFFYKHEAVLLFGMLPKAASFAAYIVADAALTAGFSWGYNKLLNPSNATVVDPSKLTEKQLERKEGRVIFIDWKGRGQRELYN